MSPESGNKVLDNQEKKIQMALKAKAKSLSRAGYTLVILGVAYLVFESLIQEYAERNRLLLIVMFPTGTGHMAITGGFSALLIGVLESKNSFPSWINILAITGGIAAILSGYLESLCDLVTLGGMCTIMSTDLKSENSMDIWMDILIITGEISAILSEGLTSKNSFPSLINILAITGGVSAILSEVLELIKSFPSGINILRRVHGLIHLYSVGYLCLRLSDIVSRQRSFGNCYGDINALLTMLCVLVIIICMTIFASAYFTIEIYICYIQLYAQNESAVRSAKSSK